MKSLVIGTTANLTHDEAVRDQFIKAYNDSGGSITSADVPIRSTASIDYQGGFDYCLANDIDIMISSYSGASGKLTIASDNYPATTLIMPSGSNTPSDLVFNYSIPQVICVTGGGDTDNETGINIEFFDNDYTTTETTPDEQDLSSFSNGYIAGKLKYIADQRNSTMWEARYCAMKTASENYVWDTNNGYGIIDVTSAIAFSGGIPTDPFYTNSYTLEAGLTSVKIKFNLNQEHVIYRKVSDVWTVIATVNSDVYEDTVTRQIAPIEYKVDTIEKSIIFTKIYKTYTR